MKYILNILFVAALLMVSCKKQECLNKNESADFSLKSGSSTSTSGNGSTETDGGIVETEDEDDKKKKGGPKGTSSK